MPETRAPLASRTHECIAAVLGYEAKPALARLVVRSPTAAGVEALLEYLADIPARMVTLVATMCRARPVSWNPGPTCSGTRP